MKQHRLIVDYIKDRIFLICIMLINTIFISIFYKVTLVGNVELLYPLVITVFLIVIFLIIDFCRYLPFNSDLEDLKISENNNIRSKTIEQERVGKALKAQKSTWIKNKEQIKVSYEEKQSFLISAIHKLKNNVGVINVTLENGDKNTNNKIRIVGEEVEEITFILDNTLNFVRLGSFYEDFEIVKLDIVQEIREVINNNRNGFISREIFPSISCSEEDIFVLTDKKWNRVILEQLISNALKYSRDGAKEIFFSIERDDRNKVVLSIKDNGIGIPEYDIDKIFNPFFTGENGRKNKNATGIGLFIVKNICKALDQAIEVKSIVNIGTEVRISYLSKL